MNLIESLQNIGLNEKEARVYVALLQLGKATAYSVSKISNLKKPTTYVILDGLIDKGIVSKVPRAKTMQYVAINPDDLFAIVKSKLETAKKDVLPELKALSRGKEHKVRVSYYEGLAGIKEMYSQLFKVAAGKSLTAFYAHSADTSPELLDYFVEVRETIRQKRIKVRGITIAHPTITQLLTQEYMKKYNLKLKALPFEKYSSNISIEIYSHYTQIFSHRHIQGVVIDNPDVARALKQVFNLVWERKDVFCKNKKNKK